MDKFLQVLTLIGMGLVMGIGQYITFWILTCLGVLIGG